MVRKGERFKIRAWELAEELDGNIIGNRDIIVSKVAPIQDADAESVTFLSNPRYVRYLENTEAGIVIISRSVKPPRGKTVIQVEDPYLAFAKVLSKYVYSPPEYCGVSRKAIIDKDVSIAKGVSIEAGTIIERGTIIGENTFIFGGVYIGRNVKIGNNCLIYPGVIIREESIIGDRVILQPGVVIGGDGFGFVPGPRGHFKIPQVGRVVIGDDVEIGANSTLDRAAVGETYVGNGTKIDNLVQIGHNVYIGQYCLIAAQVGVAGSTRIGNYVMIGGQAGIAGHLEIGDGVQIAAKSGINSSIKSGEVVGGIPAVPIKEWLRISAVWKKLPQLWDKVKKLEKTNE